MKILRKYATAFERQANEPMRIKLTKKEDNLNSKSEWNSQQVDRLRIVNLGEKTITDVTRNNEVEIESQRQISNTEKRGVGRPKGSKNKNSLKKRN